MVLSSLGRRAWVVKEKQLDFGQGARQYQYSSWVSVSSSSVDFCLASLDDEEPQAVIRSKPFLTILVLVSVLSQQWKASQE